MAAKWPKVSVALDRSAPKTAPAPTLDTAQREVIEHRSGALLVLAGPGTGKTTTLVEAMIARLSDPAAPLPTTAVLGLTFGRRAALEWRDRVAARIPTGSVPDIQTFHSFAYAVVRRFGDLDLFAPRPQVSSSADQLSRIRELLAEPVRNHEWAGEWARAIPTVGFATELQDLVTRARSLSLEPSDLLALAAQEGNPTWRSAGLFLAEYLDVTDSARVLDYAELIERARVLLQRPDVRAEIHARYRAIFVDEYQDTDVSAQELLHDLVGADASLVVVGDPDQSIYAFRGANRNGLFDFRTRFAASARAPGSPTPGQVPIVVLTRTRRFGPVIRAGATRVLHNGVIPGLSTAQVAQHRNPECVGSEPGVIEVCTFDTEGAQAAFVADVLRRAHFGAGAEVPWSQLAVLVRSGVRTIPTLRRALGLAGVPIEVAGDEIPLREEAAVAALLGAAELILRPDSVTAEEVRDLLLGPLGQLDPSELRSFARMLRVRARELAGAGIPVPGSAELVREAFTEPSELATVSGPGAQAVLRLRRIIDAAAKAQSAGPYQLLWELWSGTDWPDRLERDSLAGGARARRADRDLDSVCALFDLAAREDERLVGHKGVRSFLRQVGAQDIPTEPGTAPTMRGSGVRLLTAHRAKGLEWAFVICYGVQDRDWPDLRLPGSLLAAEKLVAGNQAGDHLTTQSTRSELLAEERRLFYVACTRARERLLVTAVVGGSEDVSPSRFLADLAGPAPAPGQPSCLYPGVTRRHESGRIPRPMSMSGLVAGLRTAATSGSPALQAAAAQRLARLALEVDANGAPVAVAAEPNNWWGVLPLTTSPSPVRPSGPVSLSASQVTAYLDCPLAWFLGHEAGGRVGRNPAMGFGSVLHAIAAAVTNGEIAADVAVIDNLLDKWWGQLGYEASWHAAAERRAASEAVSAFLKWHSNHQGRPALAAEADFNFVVAVPGDHVVLRGSVDRIEQLENNLAHVVDFKTGKNVPTKVDTEANIQLAIYQLAVAENAITAIGQHDPKFQPGGAELVYLRVLDAAGLPKAPSQAALQLESEPVALEAAESAAIASRVGIVGLLAEVAVGIRSEVFPARPETSMCANCDVRLACPAVSAEVPL